MKLSIREILFDIWSIGSMGFIFYHFILLCLHYPHGILIMEGNRAILGIEVVMVVFWLGLAIERTYDDLRTSEMEGRPVGGNSGRRSNMKWLDWAGMVLGVLVRAIQNAGKFKKEGKEAMDAIKQGRARIIATLADDTLSQSKKLMAVKDELGKVWDELDDLFPLIEGVFGLK